MRLRRFTLPCPHPACDTVWSVEADYDGPEILGVEQDQCTCEVDPERVRDAALEYVASGEYDRDQRIEAAEWRAGR